MAERNCLACEDLRENGASFVLNGVTDTVCASLQNGTGFDPSTNSDNCTDLNNANDCLIGNEIDQLEAYDVCDWKDFIRKLIPNIYNVIKAMICDLCGLRAKVDCIADNFDVISTPRMWIEKANLTYASGFNIAGASTGVATSYCNTHSYTLFSLTSAKKATLNSEEVYTTPVLVYEGTGSVEAPYNIIRMEEQVGVTSGGYFTFMANVTNNNNGTFTHRVYLRSRLRDLTDLSQDGIIVNMPTNIKLLGENVC